MRSVSFPGGGIPSFTMTKNRLFREPGVRSRSDNFSHAGMTQWGVFGARAAPKSMCTHQAHRLKKIDEKRGFYWAWFQGCLFGAYTFLGRADHKNLLNYPFRPQNIHILSIRPLEQFWWLRENGSQTPILGKHPFVFLVLQSSRLWRKGPRKSTFWRLTLKIHNFCLVRSNPIIFIQHKGLI